MENPLTHLRQLIVKRLSLEQLRTLCFDLGVRYDELGGEGLGGRTRELLAYLERQGRIFDLVEVGRQSYPDFPWDEALDAWVDWADARLDADMERLRERRDRADQARREMRQRQQVVNLRPLDVTHSFKDRVREMRALCNYLADASVRLVSIVGRGGMGKTALACRVLADLEQGSLPVPGEESQVDIDGIIYLSARSTGLGLERVYANVGRMLGEPAASRLAKRWSSRDTTLVAKVEYLLEMTQEGAYLILLDNLEEALAKDGRFKEEGLCLLVERCLTMPGGLRLIATSRQRLKLAAAALHGSRCIALHEGLPSSEAVALLHELDPDGTLGLRDATEGDLRHAVQLTGGIPRALEILAGILYQDPSASLSRLLADEALFGEQVVEQLAAQGYRRLGESERRVMEALAVFDRPVNETAIAYLLHPWFPGMEVQGSLQQLLNGYFTSVNRVSRKYELHPLDREHAYRQILDDVEQDVYNRRNLELRAADFYASMRKPESKWRSIEDLAPQLAEFEHRVRAEDYDGAYQVLRSLDSDYLYLWGHYHRLVELREQLLPNLADPRLQADNLGRLGKSCHALGRFERAVEFHERALDIARQIGDRPGEGMHLFNLGRAYRVKAHFEQAAELLQQSLNIARELGDREEEGRRLSYLGLIKRSLGWIEPAIELHQEALGVARGIKNRRMESVQLGRLGLAYRVLGRIEQSIEFQQQALDNAREIGDRWEEKSNLGHLGFAYHVLGQIELAVSYHEQSLTIARRVGDRRGEASRLCGLGLAYHALGQINQAIKFHEEALKITYETGDRRQRGYCLAWLGKALLAAGEPLKARQHFIEVLDLDVPRSGLWAALLLAVALMHQRGMAVGESFAHAVARARTMLDKTPGLYEPRYILATALVGSAVCDPRWADESQRTDLLVPALVEYHRALEICAAPGVVGDGRWQGQGPDVWVRDRATLEDDQLI